MSKRRPVRTFTFPEPALMAGSEAIMCVARVSEMRDYLSLQELDRAFSGHATYRRWPWLTQYVGVWGRRNTQRFRRFLRERGADVVSTEGRPTALRLACWRTQGERARRRRVSDL